jgi:hypothetical protein
MGFAFICILILDFNEGTIENSGDGTNGFSQSGLRIQNDGS